MRTIHKFPLPAGVPNFTLQMPLGALVVRLADQDGVATFWARVDTTAPLVDRKFSVVATGDELPPGDFLYQGTYERGPLVWHVVERG